MESEEATLRRQARQREYYLKHREKLLAYSRKYIKEHPEKQKLYREKCSQETSQRQRILSEILSAQQREIAGKFQAMATESPRKGKGIPAQILPEEKSSSEEREEDNAESRYR